MYEKYSKKNNSPYKAVDPISALSFLIPLMGDIFGANEAGNTASTAAANFDVASQNYGDLQDLYFQSELINPFANIQNQFVGQENMFFDMQNQMADLSNPYATMTNRFENMDNTFSDLQNRFGGMQNQYTGMRNQFSGLENVMEDATINQQQAEFERDMFQQSQANVLGDLRGAAGGSGIAALAQQMAQSGQIAAQKSSASIGAQEAQNQRAALAEASRLQGLEAGEASRIDQLQRGETARIDQMIRQQAGQLDIASAQAQAGLNMAEAQGATALDMAMGQQTAANEMASAQQQAALDMAAAQGATNIDVMTFQNQQQIDQMIAEGDWGLQQMELDRVTTGMGMAQSEMQAFLEQMTQAQGAQWQNIGGIGSLLGDLMGWLGDQDSLPE